MQNQIDKGNGHYRQVELVYQPRQNYADVSSSSNFECGAGTDIRQASTVYEIDPNTGSGLSRKFNLGEFAEACENDDTFVAFQIRDMIQAVIANMEYDSLTTAVTLIGKNKTNGNYGVINGATKNSSGLFVSTLAEKISYEFLMQEYVGDIKLIGGSSDYMTYFQSNSGTVSFSTLIANSTEIKRAYAMLDPYFSTYFDTIFGANEILAFIPGQLQLLTYLRYRGSRGIRNIDTETYKQGVIIDPISGMAFDYVAQFNECDGGTWTLHVGLSHKLVAIPNDFYNSTDPLYQTNGVANFKIVNP
jgi:hypothetical protein